MSQKAQEEKITLLIKPVKIPKNCPKCNGPLKLKKTLGRMLFGQCPKCKRAFALI